MAGDVFISYRWKDSAYAARLISDRLAARLGRETVFFDRNSIDKGLDFVDALTVALRTCYALVAVIGEDWGSEILRRLDEPTDYVRLEIQTALARDIRVIPVLVAGGTMPKPDDLPDSLKRLTRRNGITLSDEHIDSGVEELVMALSKALEELREREKARRAEEERREAERRAEEELLSREAARRAEEERTDRAIEQLLSAVEVAFIAQELDDLVRLTFGADLYSACVPEGMTGADATRQLIDALRRRGSVPRFLLAVQRARPGVEALRRVIIGDVAANNDAIHAVRLGLKALDQLLGEAAATEEVRALGIESRRKLEVLVLALEKLQVYKNFHDLLQQVQITHYNALVADIERLRQDQQMAASAVNLQLDVLKILCKDAMSDAEVLADSPDEFWRETKWIRILDSAIVDLRTAVKQNNDLAARRPILTIRDVIKREPPRVNNILSSSAKNLPLGNLVVTIARIASAPSLQFEQKQSLESARLALENIMSDLGGRIAIHNQWQDVETQFGGADSEFERSTPNLLDFGVYWDITKEKIKPLWDLDPSPDWVKITSEYAKNIDAALTATPVDVVGAMHGYERFRQHARMQFFAVDSDLKSFCVHILKLRRPLRELLEG